MPDRTSRCMEPSALPPKPRHPCISSARMSSSKCGATHVSCASACSPPTFPIDRRLNVSYECIGFENQEGIVRITFNRPDRLNAFNEAMHRETADAIGQVEADSAARALLLTGAGRAFCAGQDLSERDVNAGPLDLGKATGEFYNPLVRRLAALALPVVCAVNGVAAGAGVNISLACDIVLARKSAKFVQAFSSIGLIPDAGGTWALPHLIGQARALGFTLLGDAITAEKAELWRHLRKPIDNDGFDADVERIR